MPSTDNGKLAIMEFGDIWEPGLPLSPGTLGQDDQQQLIWGFPEVLWQAEVTFVGRLIFTAETMTAPTMSVEAMNSARMELEEISWPSLASEDLI